MLLKPCGRCKNLIPYGQAYCDTCKPIVEKEIEKRKEEQIRRRNVSYNKRRDKKYIKFYNSREWEALRNVKYIRSSYQCEKCGAKLGQIIDGKKTVLEVHHIIPIQTDEGWLLRYDFNNLITLCKKCHNEKHDRF